MWDQPIEAADPRDVARVVALARGALPRCGDVTVVAVDGQSGSGKTSLAVAVAADLDCPVVHMDAIYPGWDGLQPSTGLLTTQVLEPLARGERAAYRTWDWHRDAWNGTREVPRCGTLVVEGAGCSVRPAGRYAAVRVWMEAPAEVRMRRGLARDGEAYRPHWERWAAQERDVFSREHPREHADLVIDTGAGAVR